MAHSWDRNQQTFAHGFFLRNEETVKKRKNWEPIKNLSINQSINQSIKNLSNGKTYETCTACFHSD